MSSIGAEHHRRIAPWITLPAVPVALIVLTLALWLAGSASASALGDPGALTRWGLPVARLIFDSCMAITVGCLIFAAAILPRTTRPHRAGPGGRSTDGGDPQPAFLRVVNVAAAAAGVWTLSAAAMAVLSYSDASAIPVSASQDFTQGLGDYLANFAQGRAWAAATILAALTSTLTFALRSPSGLGWAVASGMGVIVPMALIGHSAGGDDHWGAVNAIGLHLAGICAWTGGIVALGLVSGLLGAKTPRLGRGKDSVPDDALPASGGSGATMDDVADATVLTGTQEASASDLSTSGKKTGKQTSKQANPMAADVLSRFSKLATAALLLVIGSGIASASIRVHTLEQLATPYGGLLIAKFLLSLFLGLLGLVHRRWIIPQLRAGVLSARAAAWRVIAVEVAVMGAVMGLAEALSRTAPPVSTAPPQEMSPARRLTGYDLPPEPKDNWWITEWRFDWLWIAVIVFLACAYILWFVRLRRRGDKWPVWRLLSFFVGLAVLFYLTSGALAVYSQVLFSTHMIDHMGLTMVAPFFLVVGSPIALALRAMSPRQDGTRGPREWTLTMLHSWWSKLVTNPIFAGVNFAGSIILFYSSDVFGLALKYHVGHELMITHFLLTGYIFAVNMIGLDPLPRRAGYPMRLVMLLATMVFHAFYSVSLMATDVLIQPDWFGNMGRDWGASAIADQHTGAGYMWGIGEVPTLLLAIGVAVAWSRSDERETKRRDREADRSGEAELNAYNDMFAQLAAADREHERRGERY